MKFLISLLTISLTLFASELKWRDLDSIKTIESEKIALVEIVSKYCHYCKSMDSKVFSDGEVIEFLTKNFTLFRGDKYEDEIESKFQTRVVPTFFFYDIKEQKVLKKVVGSWSRGDFLDFANEILKESR